MSKLVKFIDFPKDKQDKMLKRIAKKLKKELESDEALKRLLKEDVK